jgi:hypothetical protein
VFSEHLASHLAVATHGPWAQRTRKFRSSVWKFGKSPRTSALTVPGGLGAASRFSALWPGVNQPALVRGTPPRGWPVTSAKR